MKPNRFANLVLLFTFLLTALSFSSQPSYAGNNKFFCDKSKPQNIWTTFAKGTQGNVRLISWNSNALKDAGYDNEKRCKLVSQKFEKYKRDNGSLNLKTGKVDNSSVICAVKMNNEKCSRNNVLLTLNPGQNAQNTLNQLLSARTSSSGNPISMQYPKIFSYDSEGELSVNVDKLIEKLPVVPNSEIQGMKKEAKNPQ